MIRSPFRAILLSFALDACLHVAEERAQKDLEVGRAEAVGARLEVEGGLAAVRAFSAGSLELWANAPALRMTLDVPPGGPEQWSVVIHNTLEEAELTATDAAGTELEVTRVASETPTSSHFTLRSDSESALRLNFGPPDLETGEPFDFIALADVQEAIDEVRDVFEKMNTIESARFAMFSGDLTEDGSREELARFQQKMRENLRMPLFATLGNHELGTGDTPYHEYFGRGSASFVFKQTRFTFLDSASATLDPLVYDWLEGWLDAARDGNHLVFMHVPPLDPSGIRNGAFSSRAEAAKLLRMLGRGRVDTTFYGHVHSYYSFENAGIPAFISGGGGAIPERFDQIGRHFLVVSIDPKVGGTRVRVVRVD